MRHTPTLQWQHLAAFLNNDMLQSTSQSNKQEGSTRFAQKGIDPQISTPVFTPLYQPHPQRLSTLQLMCREWHVKTQDPTCVL
jgi:hypothetical protein